MVGDRFFIVFVCFLGQVSGGALVVLVSPSWASDFSLIRQSKVTKREAAPLS